MIEKPRGFAPDYAAAFQDEDVVDAYRYRPPYPAEVFSVLLGLLGAELGRVLDVGCGTGNIARQLAGRVRSVDAVDISGPMIGRGKQLPNGDHPNLRWILGRSEDVVLDPPYELITAGESLHWMDLPILLPRLRRLLTAGGYLAIVMHDTLPDPWSLLGEIASRYRTDGGYRPFKMIEQLEQHDLFETVGEKTLAPVPFAQSIEDCIASYHSRSNFTRRRMGAVRAEAFDREARAYLAEAAPDGTIAFHVVGHVLWGFPRG